MTRFGFSRWTVAALLSVICFIGNHVPAACAAPRPRIYRERIEPHWIGTGDQFWYRRSTGPDRYAFWQVDARAGRFGPAFDHARLAQAFANVLGRPIDANRLPIERLKYEGAADEILLIGERGPWIWNDRTQQLSHRDATPTAQPATTNQGAKPERRPKGGRPNADRRRGDLSDRSPDGKWQAIVRHDDLWIRDCKSGEERLVCDAGDPLFSFHRDAIAERAIGMQYGKSDYPAEQPHVYWSPDSRKLIALQTTVVPERRVTLVESSPTDQLQPRTHSYPYLKPGDAIPQSRVHLIDVMHQKTVLIDPAFYPNPWRLSEFRWSRDSTRFTFLFNRRGHQSMRLLSVDATDGIVTPLVDEQSDTFIDYSMKTYLRFLDDENDLLWMSERDGWNHLYRFNACTGELVARITKGEWVVRGVDQIDEQAGYAWLRVLGYYPGQDPYYEHLARARLDGSEIIPLTEADGTHRWQWSPDKRFIVDSWSRVDQPPVHELRDATNGSLICRFDQADASEFKEAGYTFPEPFVAKGRDAQTNVYGVIHRPRNFDAGRVYPVVENIYAGPHGAFVPKAFRARYRHQQEIADGGTIVVQIDGMGTNWRHRAFHDVAWQNIGDAGLPDRVAWIRAAARHYPFMDISRVGIYGGSAGGQNAMRALISHGDFYDVAVADCGCHDNRMDKIWWNEAWMGWPIGPHYAASSNAVHADRTQGALLLVVGELDRNVDPASTMQVVSALIRADKPFELLVVPGAGHGAAETPYGNKRRREFLWKHLLQSSSHRAQVVEDAKIEAENAKDHHDQQSGDQQPDKDARQDR